MRTSTASANARDTREGSMMHRRSARVARGRHWSTLICCRQCPHVCPVKANAGHGSREAASELDPSLHIDRGLERANMEGREEKEA